MTRPWKVHAKSQVLTNPWFSIVTSDVELPDESRIEFHSVEFARPAVGVIARSEGRILLIHQYRVTIDREVWAIPSGGTEEGETTEAAARRELLEETGYEARELRPLIAYHPSYGVTNQTFEIFLAEDPSDSPESFDRNEVIDTRWFSRDEVLELLFENQIVDGLSATPLALLFLEDELARAGRPRRLRGTL